MTRLRTTAPTLFAFLIIGALAFTGCESPASSTEAETPIVTTSDQSSKYAQMPAIPGEMREEAENATEMLRNFAPSFEKVEGLLQSLNQASALNETDQLVRDALASNQAESDLFLRSIAAEQGLIAILESDAKSDYTSSIDLYTTELLANGSHNARLIHDALEQLEGTWSEAKINDAAQLTVDRSVQWLKRTSDFTQAKSAGAQSNERLAMSVSGHQSTRENVRTGLSRLSDLMNE